MFPGIQPIPRGRQNVLGAPTSFGHLVTLNELVYAGLDVQSFSNTQVIYLNGVRHAFTIDANGAAAIVAAGLQFSSTAASSAQQRYCSLGQATDYFQRVYGFPGCCVVTGSGG